MSYMLNNHNSQSLHRVTVTGMGIVSSIGHGITSFAQALRDGVSGIHGHEDGFLGLPIKLVADIPDFSLTHALESLGTLSEEWQANVTKSARRAPYSVQASIAVGMHAWHMSKLDTHSFPRNRIGLIVAGSNGSPHLQFAQYPRFQQSPGYVTPSYISRFFDTDHVGTLSELFHIHGEGFSVGSASASGNMAIIKGKQLIQLGVVDACMVIGTLTDLSPIELMSFYNLGAMGGKKYANEPHAACRPFDRDHEGFIYGHAAACLILESAMTARERQAHVLGEVLGGSALLDGNRSTNPSEEGEMAVMEAALQEANLSPSDVEYINTHGTSTPLGDQTELQAIRRVFGEHVPKIAINSTKELTGHSLSAAGVVEAVATLLQLNEGFIHPNPNLAHPIQDDFAFSRTTIPCNSTIALSNSFGFGGINTSLVLKKGQ